MALQSLKEVRRRDLLGKVQECVAATNKAIGDVETFVDIHNAFTKKVEYEFAARDERLVRLTERCSALERDLAEVRNNEARAYNVLLAFVSLSLWERFRYFVTGTWPCPEWQLAPERGVPVRRKAVSVQ